MNTGLLVLLFVGIILMTANAATQKQQEKERVVYKYLPRDLDTYLRENSGQPSLIYEELLKTEDLMRV